MQDLLSTKIQKKKVTFSILTYNQERFIREAILGAMGQTYSPVEIIISDDCSTDNTFKVIQEMQSNYLGPHKIMVRRNQKNLGLAAHINKIIQIAQGDFLLLAAGDDISLPERTQISVELLEKHQDCNSVMLNAEIINSASQRIRKLKWPDNTKKNIQTLNDIFTWQHKTFGASRMIRLDTAKKFPPLNKSCPTEDSTLLLRTLLCGNNIISNKVGVLYRKHCDNMSSEKSLQKMNFNEIYRQYIDDFRYAEQVGYINKTQLELLRKWAIKDESLRKTSLWPNWLKKIKFKSFFFRLLKAVYILQMQIHLMVNNRSLKIEN